MDEEKTSVSHWEIGKTQTHCNKNTAHFISNPQHSMYQSKIWETGRGIFFSRWKKDPPFRSIIARSKWSVGACFKIWAPGLSFIAQRLLYSFRYSPVLCDYISHFLQVFSWFTLIGQTDGHRFHQVSVARFTAVRNTAYYIKAQIFSFWLGIFY